MSLNRVARQALLSFVLGLVCLPVAASAATTEFFVDYSRTSSGNGSSANPWKYRSDINWTAVATALQTDSVTIYFSSRSTWDDNQEIKIPNNTNTTGRVLTLDGHTRYNTASSGTAMWQAETVEANRATFTNAGGGGGSIIVKNTNAFITIRGFALLSPTWGGIVLGEDNPTLNIHDVVVENNFIDTPVNNHGVWLGYGEAGCYNITIRGNTIKNTPLEGIYMGHYNYLSNTITGTVIEYNTLINTGTAGEGDIDIKAGNFGAVIRYNTISSGSTGGVLAGIVVMASDVQIYGNELHHLRPHSVADGGNGIQINADGDGSNGRALNNILVYNNLIYGNAQRGISLYATRPGASIANVKMLNNTIVGNGDSGVHTSASPAYPIAFSAFQNNLIASNGSRSMNISDGTTFISLDYNLQYAPNLSIRYQDAEKTWSDWKALGFDAHGVNADPRLDATFSPTVGSPVLQAGIVKGEFAIDKNNRARGTTWEIGALESGANVPQPPQGLRISP